MPFIYLFVLFVYYGTAFNSKAELASIEQIVVFKSGTEGYHTFRIPAIVKAANGDLLAICEGRKIGRSDAGDIDMVMKRSSDGGKTWGSLQVIWDDGGNTCGNPAPVLDESTGKMVLLATWNLGEDSEHEIIEGTSVDTRRVYVITSEDHGASWSTPTEITSDVKEDDWTWYATGPGSGLQLKHTEYKERLVIACDHIEKDTRKYFSHAIYSDDGGVSWSLGGTTPEDQVNECEVAELPGGVLMLNMRNYDREQTYRQIAYSRDGGDTWTDQQHDIHLIEPICQASLQAMIDGNLLLFSNPAAADERKNMTLRFSYDWGYSWPAEIVLHAGPAAYSDLVEISNDVIGCLFEAGEESPYEQIVFTTINLQ